MFKRIMAALAATGMLLTGAQAATVTMSIVQVGDDVVLTATGELDLSGMVFLGTVAGFADIQADPATFIAGSPTPTPTDVYVGPVVVPSIGPGAFLSTPDSGSAGIFGIQDNGADSFLGITAGYASMDPIFETSTFADITIAALGLTEGDYSFTVGRNTILLDIGAPVPLPGAALFFAPALGGVLALRRRKKAAA